MSEVPSDLMVLTWSQIFFGSLLYWKTLEDRATTQTTWGFCSKSSHLSVMISPTLTRFPVLDTLKHPHSIIFPLSCFTTSFSNHKQRAHLTKRGPSSIHNRSPGCFQHPSIWLKGISSVENQVFLSLQPLSIPMRRSSHRLLWDYNFLLG